MLEATSLVSAGAGSAALATGAAVEAIEGVFETIGDASTAGTSGVAA